MSANVQTAPPRRRKLTPGHGGSALEFLLYGLDEAGRPTFAERLAPETRPRLREIAFERLARCATVEVWEGPTCILRVRRSGAPPG
jgi:hypothetical protein